MIEPRFLGEIGVLITFPRIVGSHRVCFVPQHTIDTIPITTLPVPTLPAPVGISNPIATGNHLSVA
jgi:hypothetical protein